jgi:hypothetical protein
MQGECSVFLVAHFVCLTSMLFLDKVEPTESRSRKRVLWKASSATREPGSGSSSSLRS